MNSTDFINELKASDLYTDGFEKTYAEFQYFQKLANDTLNEFHRVCEENWNSLSACLWFFIRCSS